MRRTSKANQVAAGQIPLQFFLGPAQVPDEASGRCVSGCDAVVRSGLAQVLEGRDREALAAELTERLARGISKATLDQWCAPSQSDRRPHVDAWLAIMQITGDVSPLELAAASLSRRVLDVLLAEAPGDGGYRTVQKKGLRLDGAWFIAPELGTCVGERVRVKLDETDLGWIYVFTADGGFLCRAACPERTGIDRREYAARARVLQKERISREKAALKAASRVDVGEVLDGILRDRASEAGKLVAMPKPATQATTPGIQAAPCIAGWS